MVERDAGALEDLQETGELRPLRTEDATPHRHPLQAQVSIASGDVGGENGIIFSPEVSTGLLDDMEFGLGAEVGRLEGETAAGPFEAYALGQFLPEGRLTPALALKGTVISPAEDISVSGQLGLLGTKRFGQGRVHATLAYRAQYGADDRAVAGLGLDHVLGGRLLALGGAFVEWLGDRDASALGGEAGALVRVNDNFSFHGAAGVLRIDGGEDDTDPLARFGVIGRY